MGNLFSASEIFQFAIKIEENGQKFYKTAAEKISDLAIKEIFLMLAEEEVRHKNTYVEMLSKIESYLPEESFPEEYFLYLKSYANNIIFNSRLEKELKDLLENFNMLSAINFAIQRELDSILYYIEIKNFVPKTQTYLVDKIVEEERKHFVKLSELKNSLEK